MHQGYQFWFFNCDSVNNDPPVYYYLEDRKNYEKVADSFSEFLENSLKNYLK